MSEKIKAAHGGDQHVPFQAPHWDYENGQVIDISSSHNETGTLDFELVLLRPTVDCFICIGDAPVAAVNAATSRGQNANELFAETITPGTKISVVCSSGTGKLSIIPAMTEVA